MVRGRFFFLSFWDCRDFDQRWNDSHQLIGLMIDKNWICYFIISWVFQNIDLVFISHLFRFGRRPAVARLTGGSKFFSLLQIISFLFSFLLIILRFEIKKKTSRRKRFFCFFFDRFFLVFGFFGSGVRLDYIDIDCNRYIIFRDGNLCLIWNRVSFANRTEILIVFFFNYNLESIFLRFVFYELWITGFFFSKK